MSLYMETTKISAEHTAQQISNLLRQASARAILTEYDENQKLSSLSFKLEIRGELVPFNLPARIEPVFQRLQKKRSARTRTDKAQQDIEQAERVAWRQLYRWIEAQLAIIDTGMVQPDEVFLPYIQTGPGETLYERMIESGRLMLPAGKVSRE